MPEPAKSLTELLVEFEKVNKRVMQMTRRLGDIQSEIAKTEAQLAYYRGAGR
ncbi:hypothetical protein ABTM80_19465 [Acinetobacter baumannii]